MSKSLKKARIWTCSQEEKAIWKRASPEQASGEGMVTWKIAWPWAGGKRDS